MSSLTKEEKDGPQKRPLSQELIQMAEAIKSSCQMALELREIAAIWYPP